jgi:hypothetical protein
MVAWVYVTWHISSAPLSGPQQAAAVAPDMCQFSSIDGPHLRCVLDRAVAHSAMAAAGIPLAPVDAPALDLAAFEEDSKQGFGGFRTLPATADGISTYYQSRHKFPTLQRALSRQLEDCLLHSFLSSAACTRSDPIRLSSCKDTSRLLHPSPLHQPLGHHAT